MNSTALDVAVGLVLVYVIFSLFCTAINEWVSRLLALRATGLRRGLDELLADGREGGLAAEFHRHPLVDALKPGDAPFLRRFSAAGRLRANYPSYISARTFALAVMDLTMHVTKPADASAPVQASLADIVKDTTTPVPDLLRTVLLDIGSNAEAVRTRLESWFDDSMVRVSGWYKRRNQVIVLVIASIVALVLDLDTIRISQRLYRDPVVRAALVAQAQQVVLLDTSAVRRDLRAQAARLEADDLPIGWQESCYPLRSLVVRDAATSRTACVASPASALGIALTVIALSLGAPFWFDALNRLVNLRQTGTPPESKRASG